MSTPPLPDDSTSPDQAAETTVWSVGSLTYTRVGLLGLFVLLLLGDFGWQMRERSVVPLGQLLLTHYKPTDLVSSLLFGSIPAAITMLIWPVVSVWSDRYRSRWGRRVPFLFWPTPVATGAMVGLAFSPQIGTWLQSLFHDIGPLHAWVIGVFSVFWVIFEVFALITNTIYIALVNDTVPRQVIGRFFAMFRIVALMAGVYFNHSLMRLADAHSTEVFLGIATAYLGALLIMCGFVKEGTYPPPPPVEHNGLTDKVRSYIRECWRQPFYRTVFITMALAEVTFIPVNIFGLFAAKAYGIETGVYGDALAATYLIGSFVAFPIGWLTDRFHPMRTSFASLALYAILMIAAYFIVRGPETFLVMFVIHGVVAGLYKTASPGLLPTLFPRLQFGQLYSATFIFSNLLAVLASPVLGRIIDLSGHNYRLTFLSAGLLALTGCASWLVLNREFQDHGGVKAYLPPSI